VTRLSVDESFVPFPVADGDELFPNGIFVFNVTRILAHLTRHPDHAELVPVAVDSFPRWSNRPVLLLLGRLVEVGAEAERVQPVAGDPFERAIASRVPRVQ